jgi:hypothetical protein
LRATSLPSPPSNMPKATQPELKKVRPALKSKLIPKYMDKRLFVQLNGSRKVIGVLRGYDVRFPFPSI